MGFGIRNTAQGIRNPTKDWNPRSTDKDWYPGQFLQFGVHQCGIQNPRLSCIPLHGATPYRNNDVIENSKIA